MSDSGLRIESATTFPLHVILTKVRIQKDRGAGSTSSPQEMNEYYIYILASKLNGTLYIGITNDLIKRVHQHKTGEIEGFTKKYEVDRLVWYEICADVREAIRREKQLKDWHRHWKIALIQRANPTWKDLYDELIGEMDCGSSPQ